VEEHVFSWPQGTDEAKAFLPNWQKDLSAQQLLHFVWHHWRLDSANASLPKKAKLVRRWPVCTV